MYLMLFLQMLLFVKAAKEEKDIDLEKVDYCQLCKIKGSHTVCRFPSAGARAPCALSPLSEAEQLRLLRAHNELRSRVARGLQPPQPPAADMLRLRWDYELQAVAARWAEQCVDDHDTCRASARFPVGQNLAWRSRWDLERLVHLWFQEVEMFNASVVEAYSFEAATGHYAQLVWAQTRLLGCERADRGSERRLRFSLVCNYGPAGNVIRKPVYRVGAPRSACPARTRPDEEYLGLCATADADFTPLRLHPSLVARAAHASTDSHLLHLPAASASPNGGHSIDENRPEAGAMRSALFLKHLQHKHEAQRPDTAPEEDKMDACDNRTRYSKCRRLKKPTPRGQRKRSRQRTGGTRHKHDARNTGSTIVEKVETYDVRPLIVLVLRMLST